MRISGGGTPPELYLDASKAIFEFVKQSPYLSQDPRSKKLYSSENFLFGNHVFGVIINDPNLPVCFALSFND